MLSYPKVLILLLVLLTLGLSSCKQSDMLTNDSISDTKQEIESLQKEEKICPECGDYPVISKYEFINIEFTGESLHCRVCGTKGVEIQRTYVVHTMCSNNCGYDVSSDTEVEYGIQCPVDGNVW